MVDLHFHSHFSDGRKSPEQIASEIAALGIRAAVLTDHDNWDGWPDWIAACDARGIRTLTGTELSTDVDGKDVHLLAYGFDPNNAALRTAIAEVRQDREARNIEILTRLRRLGYVLTPEGIARHAGGRVVGRPHIAAEMVARGIVRDAREAFDKFLAQGKPAYVPRKRLMPEDCIRLVREAGGMVSLAHPSLLKLNKTELRRFVILLASFGLGGIEVYYPGHLDGMRAEYLQLAADFDLVPTGGSDCHGIPEGPQLGVGRGSLNVPDYCFDRLQERLRFKI